MNKLVEGFIKEKKLYGDLKNNKLFKIENKKHLENEFKDYVFKIFLFSYIKKTIVFSAIKIKNKSNKIKKLEEPSLNIVDSNFNEERVNLISYDEGNFIEEICKVKEATPSYDEISHDKKIFKALNSLTDRQKEIIYRCIIIGESDTLAAKKLGISKQGVNKTKITSLKKLRAILGDKYKVI